MSEVDIVRRDKSVSVTLATTTSSASTVRLEDAAGAIVSLAPCTPAVRLFTSMAQPKKMAPTVVSTIL